MMQISQFWCMEHLMFSKISSTSPIFPAAATILSKSSTAVTSSVPALRIINMYSHPVPFLPFLLLCRHYRVRKMFPAMLLCAISHRLIQVCFFSPETLQLLVETPYMYIQRDREPLYNTSNCHPSRTHFANLASSLNTRY